MSPWLAAAALLAIYLAIGVLGSIVALAVSRSDASGDGALGILAISWGWPLALVRSAQDAMIRRRRR